jgi:hypothetical protein
LVAISLTGDLKTPKPDGQYVKNNESDSKINKTLLSSTKDTSANSDANRHLLPELQKNVRNLTKEMGIRIGAASSNANCGVNTHRRGNNAPLSMEKRKKHKTLVVIGDCTKGLCRSN